MHRRLSFLASYPNTEVNVMRNPDLIGPVPRIEPQVPRDLQLRSILYKLNWKQKRGSVNRIYEWNNELQLSEMVTK